MKETFQKTADGGVYNAEHNGQSFSMNLTMDMIKEIIKAAKEPDEETKARLAQEKAQRAEYVKQMLEVARVEEESKKQSQERCSHKKQDGSSRIHAGQVYSDMKIRPICVWCHKVWPPMDPPRDLIGATGF